MTEILTQEIIEELNFGDNDVLSRRSPLAGTFLPLLSVLDGHPNVRQLAESLPYYSFELDMDSYISIFGRMGYKTHSIKGQLDSLDDETLPCLFKNSDGHLLVIYQRVNENYMVFNANTMQTTLSSISESGQIWHFEFKGRESRKSRIQTSWFWTIAGRFRPLIRQLLGISFVLNLTTLAVPLFIMVIYDAVIGNQNIGTLPLLALAIFVILFADLALRLLRAKLLALPSGRLEYLLGTESLNQILSLPSAMTERSSVTVQLSKLRLYDNIREFCTGPTGLLALELPFIPIFIAAIAFLGGSMVVVPIVVLFFFILFGFYIIPKLNTLIDFAAEFRTEREQLIYESINATQEIKAMGEEKGWLRRIRNLNKASQSASLKASNAQVIASNITQSAMTLSAIAMIAIGGSKAINNEISIGALIAIMAILWRVIGPMQGVFLAVVQLRQINRGIRGLDELMALNTERSASSSSLMKSDFKGDIKFDRVSFRYGMNTDPVVIGASFHIQENEFVTIVGENGSGKSTLLKLLCGMYYAQIGNIYIDNTEIRQLNVGDLRRIVGYVPQHPRLFQGDINHNLRLSDILATDEQLREAAEEAGILEEIQKLPDGFSTRIGDNANHMLPSGLVRSLCIARAFVRKSPILVLDEAGANQDHKSLKQLTQQLSTIKGKRTILMISHIPKIISLSDKVIVMERGSIKKLVKPQEYIDELAKNRVNKRHEKT